MLWLVDTIVCFGHTPESAQLWEAEFNIVDEASTAEEAFELAKQDLKKEYPDLEHCFLVSAVEGKVVDSAIVKVVIDPTLVRHKAH